MECTLQVLKLAVDLEFSIATDRTRWGRGAGVKKKGYLYFVHSEMHQKYFGLTVQNLKHIGKEKKTVNKDGKIAMGINDGKSLGRNTLVVYVRNRHVVCVCVCVNAILGDPGILPDRSCGLLRNIKGGAQMPVIRIVNGWHGHATYSCWQSFVQP